MNTAEKKPQGQVKQAKAPDVLVANEGTVLVFCPMTSRAREWVDEHVQSDATWFGNALIVEYRFAWGLAQGMITDGLRLE